ncbi:hypothetical protein [Halovivax limisalsi]|uniref:hypothetical protein n=1 Tax=Halovivax limisalsi TaxID=1453760 RepID=UPI001FFD9CE4|nr:hypothetical protein [Halovivax limisalsi]
MQRRALLAGIGSTATITAFAGCLGDDDGGDGGDGGQTGSATPSIRTVNQEALDRQKESGRTIASRADVTVDGDTVEIAGQLEGATPCHEAVVSETTLEDGTLTVAVELEETDDGMCTQQIARIEYEATIEIESGDLSSVVVVHTDRVGEETVVDQAV